MTKIIIGIEKEQYTIVRNRAKSIGVALDDYIAFCIDRTLRTTVDDLQIELQQFKEKIK